MEIIFFKTVSTLNVTTASLQQPRVGASVEASTGGDPSVEAEVSVRGQTSLAKGCLGAYKRELDPGCLEKQERREGEQWKKKEKSYQSLWPREEKRPSPPCTTRGVHRRVDRLPERYVCGGGVWLDGFLCFGFR